LNLYGFADGDPINYSDPFGLCGILGAAGSVAIGAALGVATGGGYSLAAAAVDASTGAACIGAIGKAGKLVRAVGSSRRLRSALRAAGRAVGIGDDAHHIVAAGARGANGARDIMRSFGINIDDAANGVGLPRQFHQQLHTASYYAEVTNRLSAASTREEAVEILQQMGRELVQRAAK